MIENQEKGDAKDNAALRSVTHGVERIKTPCYFCHMLSGNIKLSEEFGAGKRKAIVASGGELDALEFEFNERLLTQGTSGYLRAAAAIKKIHDGKLYLKYAETFGEYCTLRLGKSRSAVYQQLQKLAISEATGEVYSTADNPLPILKGLRKLSLLKLRFCRLNLNRNNGRKGKIKPIRRSQ